MEHKTPAEQAAQTNPKIDIDELECASIPLDALHYIAQDLLEFFAYNPKDKEQSWRILWDYPEYRAKANILVRLIAEVEEAFEKCNLTCYSDKA